MDGDTVFAITWGAIWVVALGWAYLESRKAGRRLVADRSDSQEAERQRRIYLNDLARLTGDDVRTLIVDNGWTPAHDEMLALQGQVRPHVKDYPGELEDWDW